MSTFYLIIVGFIFLAALYVGLSFFFSSEEQVKKRKKRAAAAQAPQKDWPTIVSRLEKHTETLNKKIAELEKEERQRDKDLAITQLKNKQLQDKLAQEKGWREREQGSIEKQNQEAHQYKQELVKAQQSMEHEHSLRLRLERELFDAKQELSELTDNKRKMSAKIMHLESAQDQNVKELSELRKTNAQLQKKTDETTWISKIEYDKLEKLFKEKEKELDRVRRDNA